MAAKLSSILSFAWYCATSNPPSVRRQDLSRTAPSKIRRSYTTSPAGQIRSPPSHSLLSLPPSPRVISLGVQIACNAREGEILRKLPGDIDGQPFDLTSLRRCEVALLDRSEAVQVDELTDCR